MQVCKDCYPVRSIMLKCKNVVFHRLYRLYIKLADGLENIK